jgi:hypothetical protein
MNKNTYINIELTKNDINYINLILEDNDATKSEKRRARILLKVHNNKMNNFELPERSIIQEENITYSTIENLKSKFIKTGSIESTIKRKPYHPLPSKERIDKNSIKEIIIISLFPPPKGKKKWSYRMISEYYNNNNINKKISHTTVSKIMKEQK